MKIKVFLDASRVDGLNWFPTAMGATLGKQPAKLHLFIETQKKKLKSVLTVEFCFHSTSFLFSLSS